MRTRRAIFVLALVCACLPAPARAADPTFSASVEPAAITFGTTKEVVYRLQMVNGADPEHFFVFFRRPTWGPGGPLGAPVGNLSVSIEGPGTLGRIGVLTPGLPEGTCLRGYEPWGVINTEVDLPAGSTSTLVVRGETGAAPYFAGNDLGMAFQISPGGPSGTIGGIVVVPTPKPAISGPSGVLIKLTTRAKRADGERTLTVIGTTRPALRNKKLQLRYSFRRAQSVKTDRRGRFVVRGLRVPFFGRYTVQAFYRGGGGFAADRSCQARG